MRIKDLTPAQFQRYYETRLQGKRLHKAGIGFMALCPFHDDKTKSLSLNFEAGVWKCHASCGSGGVIDFEKKFTGTTDDQTAIASIADILGEQQLKMGSGSRAEVIYPYTDEFGKLLFQVVRYPGKKFIQRKPCDCQLSKSRTCEVKDCKSGWIYVDVAKARNVLYHLREVITAREVMVCEGEKDVETVRAALGLAKVDQFGKLVGESSPIAEGVAVTTCARGAGKWVDDFARYLSGKKVIVLPDNDESGEKHALVIAHSVYRYAAGVKIVRLSGLGPKEDVTNFLEKKALADLISEINKAVLWKPPEIVESCLISVREFIRNAPREVNWILEGVIEKGSNGVISARPKAGKSFTILDMAIALASGQSWMPGNGTAGFHIENPVRTAYVSREDNPHTTQWRTVKILDSRMINIEDIATYFHLNTRMQSPTMKLDDPDLLSKLLRDLEKVKTEFLILDVFRKLHDAEENDNTEMQKVMDIVTSIQEKVGCQICLVHHDNKREDATLTERLRGASAIAGFAEWVLGMKVVNPEAPKHEWVREMEVEIKAALPPDNFHFQIKDAVPPKVGICLERVFWEPPKKNRGKKADQLASAGQQSFPTDPRDEDIPF